MSFCSNCGTRLDEGSKFCNKCGAIVSQNAVNQNAELPEPGRGGVFDGPVTADLNENNGARKTNHVQKKPRKKIYIICIIAAVVLVLIGAAAILTGGFAPLRAMYDINLGNNYLSEGKYEEAIPVFEEAVGIDEKNIDSRLKLSDAYIKEGRDDEAESLLKETLLLDNANQNIYIQLAGLYEKDKKYEDLMKIFSEGLSLCKDKDKLQTEFDKLVAQINISDIEASVGQDENYTLPVTAQVQLDDDTFELPVDWNGKSADTSTAGTQKLEGTIQYINKPIAVNLSVELKPAVVTTNETADEGQFYRYDYKVPVVSVEGKYAENAAKLNSEIMEQFNKVQADNSQMASEATAEDFFEPNMKYEFTVDYEVKYNKDGLISIVITYYFFTGGAHGSAYQVAYNYDLIKGKDLLLQDFFNKDVNANDIVKEEITKQMQGNEEYESFNSADTINNYTKPFNFYFTEQGVIVWFDEYEIASYAAGMPEFLITKDVAIK